MGLNAGEVTAYLNLDDTKFNKHLDGAKSKFGGMKKHAQTVGLGMTAAITAPMALFASSAASGAAQVEQGMMKANTVFGDSIGVVEGWADANASAMGLTKKGATGLAGAFGDLLVPMGFTREEAAKMSSETVGLSGALSAWSGGTKSAAEVSAILSKAMLGEREGLKELGISVTEADVSAQLLKDGTSELTGKQLQQAKASATQKLIFDKSKDAQDAFSDSTETLSEKQLKSKAAMAQVKETLGTALVPILSTVSGIVATIAGAFNSLPGPIQIAILAFLSLIHI